MNVTVANCRYECEGTSLTIFKKTLLGSGKEKILFQCDISDIEIVFYLNNKAPQMYFVTPDMPQSHLCYAAKDPTPHIEQLYNYLISHGAVERPLGRFQAAMAKHSSTIAKLNQRKEERERKAIEQQKKKEKRKQDAAARSMEKLDARLKEKQDSAARSMEKLDMRLKAIEKAKKHRGCKEIHEIQYTCHRCSHQWYISSQDITLNLANSLNVLANGSVYSANNLKNFNQCPNCGSSATSKKTVKLWVDKKRNVVDFEQ